MWSQPAVCLLDWVVPQSGEPHTSGHIYIDTVASPRGDATMRPEQITNSPTIDSICNCTMQSLIYIIMIFIRSGHCIDI